MGDVVQPVPRGTGVAAHVGAGGEGSVAERPNALALKASVPEQHRGFKSLHFRKVGN